MTGAVFDYIIVGAGSAGCVLANRLSANGRHSVLLLEAGPENNSPWLHIPIGYGKTMFHPQLNWGFHTQAEPTMNGRQIYWPRGRCLGGSSSINGLIYIRGQAEDYDRWAAAGNAGWGWQDVLPYFIRLENNARGASALHGDQGPLRVSDIGEKHELIEAIIGAAGNLGVPRNPDFNGETQEGVGYYQLTTHRGWRSSTASAYLKPARRRKNLSVHTGAQATSLIMEGKRAKGVRYRQHGREISVLAGKEVILAAGAVASPLLLELSGIGDAVLLQDRAIPVAHHLPGVGRNLQDHLQFRLTYKVNRPITTNDELRSVFGKARIGLKWLFKRSGPLAIGINQGGMFARVLADSATPDVQFHFSTISADMAGAEPHPWSGCTLSVCQLRPTSRGELHVGTGDAPTTPAIRANYLASEHDRQVAVAGLRLARRLASADPLRGYLGEELRPGRHIESDAELLGFAREYGATIFHPVGTCKMGDDAQAVVDARLKVHGIAGLRVVDASIMPTLVSGNTNAPTIMIAEKAADLILADVQGGNPA